MIKKVAPLPEKKEYVSEKEIRNLEHLVNAIEALGLEEFIEYIKSPWKLLWPNFISGVARGFGALVGATMVIALIGWIFTLTVDLPLIGKKLEPFVTHVQGEMNKFLQQTNYKDEFQEMGKTLRAIEANTSKSQSGILQVLDNQK